MVPCNSSLSVAVPNEFDVITPGSKLFETFFQVSIDLGGELGEPCRPEAEAILSDVALATELDAFE